MAVPQKFLVSLNGIAYQMSLHWCGPSSCWILDLADQNGNAILSGVPLITGSPLLEQYEYIGIPGELFVQSDNDASAVPTYNSLGTTGHLFFVPDAA